MNSVDYDKNTLSCCYWQRGWDTIPIDHSSRCCSYANNVFTAQGVTAGVGGNNVLQAYYSLLIWMHDILYTEREKEQCMCVPSCCHHSRLRNQMFYNNKLHNVWAWEDSDNSPLSVYQPGEEHISKSCQNMWSCACVLASILFLKNLCRKWRRKKKQKKNDCTPLLLLPQNLSWSITHLISQATIHQSAKPLLQWQQSILHPETLLHYKTRKVFSIMQLGAFQPRIKGSCAWWKGELSSPINMWELPKTS